MSFHSDMMGYVNETPTPEELEQDRLKNQRSKELRAKAQAILLAAGFEVNDILRILR